MPRLQVFFTAKNKTKARIRRRRRGESIKWALHMHMRMRMRICWYSTPHGLLRLLDSDSEQTTEEGEAQYMLS